jgi:hypothetical protein
MHCYRNSICCRTIVPVDAIDAIDAICIMQPSNAAYHANNYKSKSGNGSGINAAKAKTN